MRSHALAASLLAMLLAAAPLRAQPAVEAAHGAAGGPSPEAVARVLRPLVAPALAGAGPSAAVFHRTPPLPPPLPSRDPWFGFDKVQHFSFSFLLTVGSQYALVNKADMSESAALPASAGVSAGIGVAKEVYDARRPGGTGFSFKDLVWDAAGIACASLLIAL